MPWSDPNPVRYVCSCGAEQGHQHYLMENSFNHRKVVVGGWWHTGDVVASPDWNGQWQKPK